MYEIASKNRIYIKMIEIGWDTEREGEREVVCVIEQEREGERERENMKIKFECYDIAM